MRYRDFLYSVTLPISGLSAVFILLLAAACSGNGGVATTGSNPLQPSPGGCIGPPNLRSYPSSPDAIQQWINAMDYPKIRAHAWDIWEAINLPSTVPAQPIWETWYSGHELFEMGPAARDKRHGVRDFEKPAQFFHASAVNKAGIPVDDAERPTSFNRFSRSLADYIWGKRYNEGAVLTTINDAFTAKGTPVAQREISTSADSIDALSFALKPVFQFISGDGPSAIPYWAGISPQSTTNLSNPEPHTWRQCVVVDPTGGLKPGTTARMPCNGREKEWPVVSLDDFYTIKITAEMEAAFSQFAEGSSDDIGAGNLTDTTSVKNMVKEGNFAMLMAMHVTGKEIVNWTWQTFWWSATPNLPPFGHDRPSTIPRPWSSYAMRTAYFMVEPPNTPEGGAPLHSFNPYLETNLHGWAIVAQDSIEWFGVFSNCMSCHRMAAWPDNQYVPDGFIDKGDPSFFAGKTKTDFLWSVASRAKKQ